MDEGRSAFKVLTGTPTVKRPLGRPRRKWKDTIRMDCAKFDFISGCVSAFICSVYRVLKDLPVWPM